MYQSIDDDLEEEERGLGLGALAMPLVLAALAGSVVFALVYLASPGEPAASDPVTTAPEARDAYLRAIGEPRAALRRARLQDFLNQNSQDARASAAQAQLDVIEAEEASAWQAAVSRAYDTFADPAERRADVERFAREWGGYLGGRDADIETLLAEIDGSVEAAPKPDRSLQAGGSAIPKSVPSDTLAGGPPIASPPPIYRPPVVTTPTPAPRTAQVVEPPRVRRNVTPRYPRSARRRGVEAIVTLTLNIDADGRVAMTEVVSVDAERYAEDFVKASERAALRTRFHPKTVDGEPVPAMGVRKRYRFESSRR